MHRIDLIHKRIFRNNYGINDMPSEKKIVNIERYPINNVGDCLSPIIIQWLLDKKNIKIDSRINGTKHLLSVGSVISMGFFDTTVWGSGLINEEAKGIVAYKKNRYRRKLDVRAVRGPLTRNILLELGYNCPEIYGDPAVLMPLIYPGRTENKDVISLILHYRTHIVTDYEKDASSQYQFYIDDEVLNKYTIQYIDPKTDDYKLFIDKLLKSKLVISSSLHGIILAESYGIPAIFLNVGIDDQLFKFKDWYMSTGRKMEFANSIQDALIFEPNEIPDLTKIRKELMNSFPYDLWEENLH